MCEEPPRQTTPALSCVTARTGLAAFDAGLPRKHLLDAHRSVRGRTDGMTAKPILEVTPEDDDVSGA